MKIMRYKEKYSLTPNFIAYRQSGDYLFIQELISKPNKYHYNIGVWHIKYKNSSTENQT
jgi:hypothetical protein